MSRRHRADKRHVVPDARYKSPLVAHLVNVIMKNGKKNLRGTLAMARTRIPDSATSQFFINVVDNAFLDDPRDGAAYAVFGKIVSGMDTVDKIKTVKTGVSGQHENVPTEPVIINSVTRMTPDEARKAIGEGAKQ